MTLIPSGVIVCWPSTNASIPAGWTRETSLDGYYIQAPAAGNNGDLTTVRGNATHIHTSPTHTPVQNSHNHSVSGASITPPRTLAGSITQSSTHGHNAGNSSNATATNNGIAITVDAFTNDLSFITVIFIKSDGTPTGIPNGAYAFFGGDTLPTSWSRTQGDRYLKGAAAAGDGGTTGGSNSHTHTSPAHTHTQNAHSHGAFNSVADAAAAGTSDAPAGVIYAESTHSHSLTLNSNTATNQSVTTTINSTNAEPVFKKINLVSNGVGAADLPNSIVALWGGTNASIPTNWSRLTAMDGNFSKHANANGESLVSTGGSLTHGHTATNCQPTQNSHSHTATNGGVNITTDGTDISPGSGTNRGAADTHNHTWTVSSPTATNQSTAVSIDTSASEAAYPQYKQTIFIQFTQPPQTGTPNLMMMGVG